MKGNGEMSDILKQINELMHKATVEAFESANCEVNFKVDGTIVEGNVQGNIIGLFFVITTLIDNICEKSGKSREEVINSLNTVWKMTHNVYCHNKEQAEVMEQIIKQAYEQNGEDK